VSLLFLTFSAAFAQAHFSAQFQHIEDKTIVQVSMVLDNGFHIYGIEPVEGPTPTSFFLNGAKIESVVQTPEQHAHFDEGFQTDVIWYSDTGAFLIRIDRLLSADDIFQIEHQLCTDSFCHPPKRETLALKEARFDFDKTVLTATVEQTKRSFKSNNNDGLFAYLSVAIAAGFLALLTPCVFPMIPITVSFFTKNGEETRGKAVRLGLVYGAGIVLIFTIFGFAIAQIFGATGVQDIAANPWVNILIGVLFIVFALSLFGLFEINLPTGLVNTMNKFGLKSGYLGVLFAGVAFALVTFTCTAPFFGGLIAQAAQGQWFYPLLGMFAFSTVFASPFVLLAIFPQWIAQMPKSGSWLHATKIVMAFVEVAAAIKFFSQADLVWNLELLTRPMMLILWTALFALSAFYLLGFFKLSEDDRIEKLGPVRLFNAFLFLVAALYLGSGITGRNLQADIDAYLPPTNYGQQVGLHDEESENELPWIESYSEALAEAKRSGKPLLIDFTGKTCTNCRWMEKNMFTKPAVEAAFEHYTLVRLWTDFGEDKALNQALQLRLFQSVALPYYAILNADETILAEFAGMTRDENQFLEFLGY
jgi:thiol:disulfide interchange protein DsbD